MRKLDKQKRLWYHLFIPTYERKEISMEKIMKELKSLSLFIGFDFCVEIIPVIFVKFSQNNIFLKGKEKEKHEAICRGSSPRRMLNSLNL